MKRTRPPIRADPFICTKKTKHTKTKSIKIKNERHYKT